MFYIYKIAALMAFFSLAGNVSDAKGQDGWTAFQEENRSQVFFGPQPKYETRAVWLTTLNGLDWPRNQARDAAGIARQKAELCRILDSYQRIHINTVVLQTRIRGTVIYPSRYEPWDECLTGMPGQHPGYDPLKFCIEECHRRGMELHAWLVCIPLGKVAKQKPFGKQSIVKRHPDLCKAVGQDLFMVPGRPETASYIAALCREVAENYDVDGISLDYIRYPEASFRFSDDEFYGGQTSSMTGSAAPVRHTRRRGRSHRVAVPAISPVLLAQWRRDNITRIVRAVRDSVKAVKQWVKLSSSPIGKYRDLSRYSAGGWDCFDAVYQDPQSWLKDNLQDMLFPMMYFQGNNFYPFLFDWQEHSYGHPVVPGLGIYFLDPREGKWTLDMVRAQMHTARRCGIGGMAFYRSAFLTRNVKGLYDCCREEFFPCPALTPPMTWMSIPMQPQAPTHLRLADGWLQWQGDAPYYNIYGSNQWPVDCTRAENLLAVRQYGNAFETGNGKVRMVRYYAVTACDRYGHESASVQSSSGPVQEVKPLRVGYLINRDLKGQKKSEKRKKRK